MSNKKQDNNGRNPSGRYAIPFFVAMSILTILSFLIPLRPTVSNMEKRELAKFPEFTMDALLSGEYFGDISLWFSDTFPGRESWIQMATFTESFHGYSDISIEGALPSTDEIPVAVQVPQTEDPGLSETVHSEQNYEHQTSAAATPEESMPEETQWGGIDADAAEILQTGAVIQIDDTVFQAQGFSQRASDDYIQVLNDFAAKVADMDVTTVSAPPPTAIGIMIEEEYLADFNSVSQVDIIDYMHSGMVDEIVKVDTATALLQHNDEYIYFRTDHHWTALGAYYAYVAVCESIGVEAVDISTMEIWPQGEFRGSLHVQASRPNRLRSDTVDAYIPNGDISHQIYTGEGFSKEWPLLSDMNERAENAKYIVFGSDFPMTHTVNHSIPDAPNCILIKDSYGNPFVTFMCQSFHNVYAIDYRKYYQTPVTELIKEYDIDYVIFMPNLTATQALQGPGMVRNVVMRYY